MASGSKYTRSVMEEFLTDPIEYSDLGDVFKASVMNTINEDTSTGMFMNRIPVRPRNESIRQFESEGKLPKGYVQGFERKRRGRGYSYDYDGMAKDIQANYPDLEISTYAQMHEERNEEMAEKRAERQDVISRGQTGSAIAQFAGGMVGVTASVEGIAMAFIAPLTGVKGLSKAAYSISMAKQGAKVGVLSAAAVEPFIYSWRQEINSEYSVSDAMFNIGASGVMNGVIGGISGAFLFKKFDDAKPTKTTLDEKTDELIKQGLDKDEAEPIANTLHTAENSPNPDMPREEYFDRMNSTEESMNNPLSKDRDTSDLTEDMFADKEFSQSLLDENDLSFTTDQGEVKYKDADASFDERMNMYERTMDCFING